MDFQRLVSEHKWIVLFATVISVLVFALSPAEPLLYDNALYTDISKNLLKSGCFCSNYQQQPTTPPIFPLLEAGFMLAFGEGFIKPMLAFIAAFAILSSYLLTLRISRNKRTALLSTIFLFMTPLVFYNSLLPLMDLIFSGLIFLSIWSYIEFIEKGSKSNIFICAIITALAIMTKFTGYLLFPIYIIYFLVRRNRLKIGVKQILFLFMLIIIFLLPWSIWRFALASNEAKVAGVFFSGLGYGHLVFRLESFFYNGEPVNMIPLSIDTNVPIQLVNLARILATLIIYATPLMAISFAYFLLKRKKFGKNKYDGLMIIWFFAFFIFHIIGFSYFGARYLIPFALPLAFLFVRFIEANLNKRKLIAISLILLQAVLVVGISYFIFKENLSENNTQIFEEAGLWIRDNTPPVTTVLPLGAPSGALVYYGERKVVGTNETADIIVESNFWYSISLDQYEKEHGIDFTQIKEFSDSRYFARIYKKT